MFTSLKYLLPLLATLTMAASPPPVWVSRTFNSHFYCPTGIYPTSLQKVMSGYKPFTSYGKHLADGLKPLLKQQNIPILNYHLETPPGAQPPKDTEILEFFLHIPAGDLTKAEKLGFYRQDHQTWVSLKVNGPPQCEDTTKTLPQKDSCWWVTKLAQAQIPVLGHTRQSLPVCSACSICPQYSHEYRFKVPKAMGAAAQKILVP